MISVVGLHKQLGIRQGARCYDVIIIRVHAVTLELDIDSERQHWSDLELPYPPGASSRTSTRILPWTFAVGKYLDLNYYGFPGRNCYSKVVLTLYVLTCTFLYFSCT